jgi:ribosome maturation factor RimP
MTYMLSSPGVRHLLDREHLDKYVGKEIAGTWTVTNLDNGKSVRISERSPLRIEDVIRISGGP